MFKTNFFEKTSKKFVFIKKSTTFALLISRSGAVVARWAHNPKVAGSSPVSATKLKESSKGGSFFVSAFL